MKFPRPNSRWLLALLLASVVASVAGCASNAADSQNLSERPWNAPTSWDNGLPSSLTEGH
jgi:hypothetical protein